MTTEEVRALLATAVAEAGGVRAWARGAGVSAAYVSDVLRSRRDPGPSIASHLGLRATRLTQVYFVKSPAKP